MSKSAGMFTHQFFHGTRADLEPGDLMRDNIARLKAEGRDVIID